MNAPIMLARAGQMTEQEYDKERARFSRRLYRVNSIEAAAKRDQALAILFGCHCHGFVPDLREAAEDYDACDAGRGS
jgi:hypothetical protein